MTKIEIRQNLNFMRSQLPYLIGAAGVKLLSKKSLKKESGKNPVLPGHLKQRQ